MTTSSIINLFALQNNGTVRQCHGQTVVYWESYEYRHHVATMFDWAGRVVYECRNADPFGNFENVAEQALRASRCLPTLYARQTLMNLAEYYIDGKCAGSYTTQACLGKARARCEEIAAMNYAAQWAIADAAK